MQLTIPGQPIPKARMTQAGKWNPRARATLEYQKIVGLYALRWMRENPDEADAIYKAPELTITKLWFYRHGNQRGDIDNFIKTLLDGLQYGGLFVNDNRVTRIQDVCVVYGVEQPYCEVTLTVPTDGDGY